MLKNTEKYIVTKVKMYVNRPGIHNIHAHLFLIKLHIYHMAGSGSQVKFMYQNACNN